MDEEFHSIVCVYRINYQYPELKIQCLVNLCYLIIEESLMPSCQSTSPSAFTILTQYLVHPTSILTHWGRDKMPPFRRRHFQTHFLECQINNNPALVQMMAWRQSGDKPLSEPMMVNLLTHICVFRPQWVNLSTVGNTLGAHSVMWLLIPWWRQCIKPSVSAMLTG